MLQEYEAWLHAKKPRKTSDDCHTPPDVYNAVAEYVSKRFNVSRETFCRPFFPGGDYESFNYDGRIVVDNPPFSILSQITKFYTTKGIKFFLFVPALTSFASSNYFDTCHIFVPKSLIYDNKVAVKTCFLTNLDTVIIACTAPDLAAALEACPSQKTIPLKSAGLEADEFHGAKLVTLARTTDYTIRRDQIAEYVKTTRKGKKIFGGGFRLKKGEQVG